MRSRRVELAASSASACAAASAGSSASRSRAASKASPTRPAALSRGAIANETVSRSTVAGRDPCPFEAVRRSRAAARSAGGSSPSRAIARFSPDDRGDVGDAADRRQVGEVQGEGRSTGHVGEQELGDLERDAAAGQPPIRVAWRRRDAG